MDLALNDLHRFICHKTKTNKCKLTEQEIQFAQLRKM